MNTMNTMKTNTWVAVITRIAAVIVVATILIMPSSAHAATTDFEVSGWIPYWATKAGTKDARANLEILTEINPFVFSVKENGTLKDLGGLKKSDWTRLIKAARKENVRVVPTIMWSDTEKIHEILSDDRARSKHVAAIISMVKKGKYDGVDIDYEGKKSATKPYFSLFLTELSAALQKTDKILSCTVEARTPPDSLYKIVPPTVNYANDYAVISQVCDQVKIMTYDQQRADIKLNEMKTGVPYIPVADVDWVRKVVNFTALSIPREKIVLGVPTYGREWVVTVEPNWFREYKNLQSLNTDKAFDVAADYNITPIRNAAGEVSYTFIPDDSPFAFLAGPTGAPETPWLGNLDGGSSSNTSSRNSRRNRKPEPTRPVQNGNDVALRALNYANATGQTVKFNIVWWSDAEAIKQKVDLAHELGLGGIAIFKIDGEEDERVWDLF